MKNLKVIACHNAGTDGWLIVDGREIEYDVTVAETPLAGKARGHEAAGDYCPGSEAFAADLRKELAEFFPHLPEEFPVSDVINGKVADCGEEDATAVADFSSSWIAVNARIRTADVWCFQENGIETSILLDGTEGFTLEEPNMSEHILAAWEECGVGEGLDAAEFDEFRFVRVTDGKGIARVIVL